jgi:lipoyl(octanoyl) transferase
MAVNNRPAYLLNLAETPYLEAHALQTAANAARHAGRLDRDLVIMLEHPPVFTLGRRGGRENLVVPEETLRRRGIEIIPVERGGDITYHGPGQLVAYLIVDLKPGRWTVVDFVSRLESAMVCTAAQWGIAATGNDDFRGAWIAERKLGSVGITIRRGITFHGLALNVNTDLEPFSWINPCGIQGCAMTSLAQELGYTVDMEPVRRQMTEQLSAQFGLVFEALPIETAKAIIQGPVKAM